MAGLSPAFCTQGCGFDPCPSRCTWTATMSHDYAACKKPLSACLSWMFSAKLNPKYGFASPELGCLPLGRKLGVTTICGNWYGLYVAALKSDASSRGMY
ncbi:hypothetical protein TNCV_4925451 [Trichonephila clavipes]|nr:hypothetical protein TNCV_4925451 [Trichonephila clavipes]